MADPVVMPKLGMTMVEGTVTEWYSANGDTVAPGDLLFAFETEKVNYDVEAETAGTLHVVIGVDETVEAGATVGYILSDGESPPATDGPTRTSVPAMPASPNPAPPAEATPAAAKTAAGGRTSPAVKRLAAEHGVDLTTVQGSGVGGRILRDDVIAASLATPAMASLSPPPTSGEVVKSSPAAKHLAAERGVNLAKLSGSGPGGRIVVSDVEAATVGDPEAPASTVDKGGGTTPTTFPFRGMRRTIAARMHESLQTMAQLTMAMDIDMTRAVTLRDELIDLWEADGVRATYTDFVIKAAAVALRDHPRINASLQKDVVTVHPDVHVGFAVALDEGLIVPVTRHTDRTPLQDLAYATADLAARARSNQLTPDDLTGGTFTVTSLGMYGIDAFTPIINPPQAAILGVGSVADRPVFTDAKGTEIERRSFVKLSLTIDHRILDGAPGADYLRSIKHILEHPSKLLIP